MPKLVHAIAIGDFNSPFWFRSFSYHNNAEVCSSLLPMLYVFTYFIYVERLFWNQYDICSTSDSRFQGYPASVSSHNFNYQDSMVSFSRCVNSVKSFGCDRYSCVEAKSVVGISQVVVYGFRHRNAWKPHFI